VSENSHHIDEIDTLPPPPALQKSGKPAKTTHAATPPAPGSLSLRLDELNEWDVPDAHNLATTRSETLHPQIDEIDTVPERPGERPKALVPARSASREVAIDAASWTAGAHTSTVQLLAKHEKRSKASNSSNFHPLDRLRWWLLRPGHLEFILWLVGAILLFGITFLLLLATVLSLMLPGLAGSGNFHNSTVTGSSPSTVLQTPAAQATVVTSQVALSPTDGTVSATPNSSNLGSAVNTPGPALFFTNLNHLNPLIWLIVVCYFLSMVFLVVAGILRRRRR
jgi:hypothetical protein